MRITEGGICEQNLLLCQYPFSQTFRSAGIQNVLSTQRQNAVVGFGHIQRCKVRLRLYADVGITVDGNVSDVVQQLVAAVQGFLEDKQLRCIINKVGSIIALDEVRVLQYVFQKLDIGFDAADTEFF